MDLPESLKLESARLVDEQLCGASALIPLLSLGQAQWGHVSEAWTTHVAELLDLPLVRVASVASCLPGLVRGQTGRHILALCRSLSCRLSGYDAVAEHLAAALGIAPGETTADGRITLVEVDCLGACSTAPAMLVDGQLHDSLTLARIDEILESLS